MWGFVIVALILAIAIPLAIAHNKKTNLAWSDAARTLGLSYRPGGFMQSRRIDGQLNGLRVVVDTFTRSSGKHSTSYTRYRISFPRSLGLGLQLKREGVLSTVTKIFGAQDLQVGDASFDNAMLVKGHDARAVRERARDPGLGGLLARLVHPRERAAEVLAPQRLGQVRHATRYRDQERLAPRLR